MMTDSAPNQISFTVPLVPPNLNHYKVPIWQQRRFAITREATAFKEALSLCCGNQFVEGDCFEVEATVYLGDGNKGDVDGFGKLILDGLAERGVFQRDRPNHKSTRHPIRQYLSDNYVSDLILRKRRDRQNPRTEITVRAIG